MKQTQSVIICPLMLPAPSSQLPAPTQIPDINYFEQNEQALQTEHFPRTPRDVNFNYRERNNINQVKCAPEFSTDRAGRAQPARALPRYTYVQVHCRSALLNISRETQSLVELCSTT